MLSPTELVGRVGSAARAKDVRGIVESLRDVAVLSSPAPPLFRHLIACLHNLKCNPKAGEENKAYRHCYQYISWLASSGLLSEGENNIVLHQLAGRDMKNLELMPLRMAAMQLFAEISVLSPSAASEFCGGEGWLQMCLGPSCRCAAPPPAHSPSPPSSLLPPP